MNDRELYHQKRRAQLDEWRADVDKLSARASQASASAQLEMNKKVKELHGILETGEAKLTELSSAGDDAWHSLKGGVESAWDSIKSAISDAASSFKN